MKLGNLHSVSVFKGTDDSYPETSPYLPAENYPEFRGKVGPSSERNPVYPLFRNLLALMKWDEARFGTPEWNPFEVLVRPGDKVLIKPNLVRHLHLGGGDYRTVVTHPSIVRCVLDYIALSLKGRGEIVVGDAPVQSADFDMVVERNGLKVLCEDVSFTWGVPVKLVDFRLWTVTLDENHRVVTGETRSGDPKGYRIVDLADRSLLVPISSEKEKYRVTNYPCGTMQEHHNEEKNEYLIPNSVLDADVVINLPKLKTHRKVGMTAALKNLVGINGFKDWLPHHRCGAITEGGDEYLTPSLLKKFQTVSIEGMDRDPHSPLNRLQRQVVRAAELLSRKFGADPYFEGSWFGNDTLWRTVLDLNRLLSFAGRDGAMRETPQRRCFTIVDAVIAGEGEGPMEPDARPCGILAAGRNPVAVDAALATLIGFDYRKIPIIAKAFEIKDWPLVDFTPGEIGIVSNDPRISTLKVGDPCNLYNFRPSAGWSGHIENKGIPG
jgi:uncharacterized protein (DUF362 family)